jgi:hypothetical protein
MSEGKSLHQLPLEDGSRVRCVRAASLSFTKGKIYSIHKLIDPKYLYITNDYRVAPINHYPLSKFVLHQPLSVEEILRTPLDKQK